MSLWRKRKTSDTNRDTIAPNVYHNGQKTPKLFTMTATTDNDLSIKSDDLSIKQSKGIDMSKEAMKVEGPLHVVCKCDKCKAQPEQNKTYVYASSLATAIWQKHYMKESPKFALLDTTEGVLTQIDNMTCGLVREKPAQPKQEQGEPVAYINIEKRRLEWAHDYMSWDTPTVVNLPRIPLYTTPQQRTWVGLTDEEIGMAFRAVFPVGGVVFTNGATEFAQTIERKLKEKNT